MAPSTVLGTVNDNPYPLASHRDDVLILLHLLLNLLWVTTLYLHWIPVYHVHTDKGSALFPLLGDSAQVFL